MKRWMQGVMTALLFLAVSACGVQKPPADGLPAADQAGQGLQAEDSQQTGPQAGQFVFTRENFPRLDGSTSTAPLARAAAAVLLAEEPAQVEDLVQFSRTTQSYRNLIQGEADLLLAAEPAEGIWEEKAQAGYEWVMEPFALDGLVFVVSSENPVDSLTAEQVRNIYAGEITNWAEVGGEDLPIAAFQRNAEAGSQTMMQKLVMDGVPMAEPPMEYVVESMYGLMEAVKTYDGSAGAIGYSVYYYANDMQMAEGLKVLRIEGVEPSAVSFRDGTYPFVNPYYVLMQAGLPEEDPVSILFHWILSREGQRLVAEMGYAAVLETEG